MKIRNGVLAVFLAITAPYSDKLQAATSKVWAAATYHKLTVGTSTREEVLKVLGKPKTIGKEQDTGLPTMTYLVSDPVPGTLVAYIEKGCS
jgi:hypothetical protein